MTTLYKLTGSSGNTRDHTYWDVGVTHSVRHRRTNPRLCTEDVIHAYRSLNLAFLLNALHANFRDPIPWEAEGEVVVEDWGKVGVFTLTITKRLDVPAWFMDENIKWRVRLAFTILCAEQVLGIYEKAYPDDNRPRKAIEAAKIHLRNPTAAAAADAAADAAAAYAAAYAVAYAAAAARAAGIDIDLDALADQAIEIAATLEIEERK